MLFNFEMANSVPEFGRRFFIDNAIDIRKEIKLLSQDQVLDKRLMAAICKAGIQNA